ncbi:MAG: M56 family metallopeptidase [Acidimicrobiales bacterium]
MTLAIAAVGLAMLVLPGLMRLIGRRVDPGSWAKLVAIAIFSGMVLFELAMLFAAAPPGLRLLGLSQLAAVCERMLGALSPGGIPLALGATAVAILVPLAAWRGATSARRVARMARVERGVGRHRDLPCGAVLVVLPERQPLAVSVPGRQGQIIVSQGLIDALDEAGFQAVCDHEAAHLRLRHARYLALGAAAERGFRFWPPARSSTAVLRVALERWADEEAAGASGERRATLRDALVSVALAPAAEELAAFSGASGLIERIDALVHPPAPASLVWWPVLLLPGVTLGAAAALGLGAWTQQAYCAVGMATHCMT